MSDTLTSFESAVADMTGQVLKNAPKDGAQGAVTCVITQDAEGTVNAVAGVLTASCDDDANSDDVVHALHHRLQLLEDVQTALKNKAVEIYRQIVEIKTAQLNKTTGQSH